MSPEYRLNLTTNAYNERANEETKFRGEMMDDEMRNGGVMFYEIPFALTAIPTMFSFHGKSRSP